MLWALVGLAALLLMVLVGLYNRLVRMRQMVRNAWSDVDVYLKRRADLIPNLVAGVQGYAEHERSTLEATTDARSAALSAGRDVAERAAAEQRLSSRIGEILMLAESYPELKAQASFLALQRSLADTEKLIASARQYYNACVRDYNIMLEAFPSNVVAGIGGFKQADFFEVDDSLERLAPSVKGVP